MNHQLCPCGCGRRVPFGLHGTAAALQALDRAQAWSEPMLRSDARFFADDPEVAATLLTLVTQMNLLRVGLQAYLHRVARPSTTPDMLELFRWQQALMAQLERMYLSPDDLDDDELEAQP
jgi:hypothetical protein